MNQFNRAAAEAKGREIFPDREFSLNISEAKVISFIQGARWQWEQSQPLPTREVIEFDLDKLKTGDWELQHREGANAIEFAIVAGCVVSSWVKNMEASMYSPRLFYLLRLIRKPVPTRKGWVNLYKGVKLGLYETKEEAMAHIVYNKASLFSYYDTICIEEPINQEKK